MNSIPVPILKIYTAIFVFVQGDRTHRVAITILASSPENALETADTNFDDIYEEGFVLQDQYLVDETRIRL